jgi:hypothetical protein
MQQGQKTQCVKRLDGLNVSELRPGDVLLVHTYNGRYTIVYLGYGTARIFGARETGPVEEPETANILGSSWDGKSLVVGFIGEGRCLEVELPDRHEFFSTSPIESIWRVGREPGFGARQTTD